MPRKISEDGSADAQESQTVARQHPIAKSPKVSRWARPLHPSSVKVEAVEPARMAREKPRTRKPRQPSPQEQGVKEEEDQFFGDYAHEFSYVGYARQPADRRLFSASGFTAVNETEFRVYTDTVGRGRIAGVLLLTEQGRVVFADKMGHQLLEGSLNNFNILNVQNLLLESMRDAYSREMKELSKNGWKMSEWLIYSKNSKRKYSSAPAGQADVRDIYYRFLKAITVRVRPIRLSLPQAPALKGYWNESFQPMEEGAPYFLLEAKLSDRMPTLTEWMLNGDPVIAKYIRSNAKKAERAAAQQIPQQIKLEEEESPQTEPDPVPIEEEESDSASIHSLRLSNVTFLAPEDSPSIPFEVQIPKDPFTFSFEEMVKVEEGDVEEREMALKRRESSGDGVGMFPAVNLDDLE